MEPRPELKRQSIRISTVLIGVLAVLQFILGFCCFFVEKVIPPSPEAQPIFRLIIYSIGTLAIIGSAFLFLFINVARDIYYQSHLVDYYVEEAAYYHTQSMRMMQSIEGMLQQQCYSQQPSYTQTSYMPIAQYEQPQNAFQFDRPSQAQRHAHSPEKNMTRQQYESQEETEANYKAQYMRPAPKKKKTVSSKKE